ncbi:HNH endonuclease [Nocardioides pacificus]
MAVIPEPNQAAPIGEFVRRHLPQILELCRREPGELINLQDKAYCLATFRQSYPVLLAKVSNQKPAKYWSAKLSAPFSGAGFWVTSEWVAPLHTAHFVAYLVAKGIEPLGVDEDFIVWAQETVDKTGTTGTAPGGARYRATPIGTVQNALVRHLLGSLSFETFSKADWERIKVEDFAGGCAYCGLLGKTEMDHAVPISRVRQGEHRLGNLVPACAACNAKKSQQHYVAFLRMKFRDDPEQGEARIAAVQRHADRYGYRPIEDREGVRPLLEEARAAVKALAEEYRVRINKQLGHSRDE